MAAEYRGLPVSRRRFVQGAGLAGCGRWPGQAPPRMYRIGWLGVRATAAVQQGDVPLTAFREGMSALGYVESQHYIIEYRTSGDREDRLPEPAVEPFQPPVECSSSVADRHR